MYRLSFLRAQKGENREGSKVAGSDSGNAIEIAQEEAGSGGVEDEMQAKLTQQFPIEWTFDDANKGFNLQTSSLWVFESHARPRLANSQGRRVFLRRWVEMRAAVSRERDSVVAWSGLHVI